MKPIDWKRVSMLGRVIGPPAALLFVFGVGTILLASWWSGSVVREEAVRAATAEVARFHQLRNLYLDQVASRASSESTKELPMLESLMQDVASRPGYDDQPVLRVYSEFPFSGRRNRRLDDFQKEALQALKQSPDEPFVRKATNRSGDDDRFRIAVADRMGPACVRCHNAHPSSPFRRWKVGDVRGVVEVEVPTARLASASRISAVLIAAGALGSLLAAAFLALWLFHGSVLGPFLELLREMAGVTAQAEQLSEQVSGEAERVASNSSQQASSVEQTAANITELAAMVDKNSESATKAQDSARFSRETAEKGAKELGHLIQYMSDLSESSHKIAEVTKVIDDIAFQTNLLALNASVEAARAGEHGKGFGVVAEAVRSLAERCAGAARDISEMIRENAVRAERGAKLAGSGSETLNQIVEKAAEVSTLVEEIALSSREQATGVEQIQQAISLLDRSVQASAGAVQEVVGAAQELDRRVASLGRLGRMVSTWADGADGDDDFPTDHASGNVGDVEKPRDSGAPPPKQGLQLVVNNAPDKILSEFEFNEKPADPGAGQTGTP